MLPQIPGDFAIIEFSLPTHIHLAIGLIINVSEDGLFIELIGMTLVNRFLKASGIHIYITSSVHSIVCSPLPIKSPSITMHLPLLFSTLLLPPHPLSSGNHRTLSVSTSLPFLLFLNLFNFLTQPPAPSPLTAISLFSEDSRHRCYHCNCWPKMF